METHICDIGGIFSASHFDSSPATLMVSQVGPPSWNTHRLPGFPDLPERIRIENVFSLLLLIAIVVFFAVPKNQFVRDR